MKTRLSVLAASIVLILAILACGMPISQSNSNQQSDLAMTITAQALIIQNSTDQAMVKHAITRVPHTKDTPTTAPASASSVPMVSVSSPTNCRTGPSTDYDLLYTLDVGQTAEVVGRYSGGNYWVIKIPGGVGTCWLWGEYATIIGNVDSLPEMIPPPVPPTATPTSFIKYFKPGVVGPFQLIPSPTPTPFIKYFKPGVVGPFQLIPSPTPTPFTKYFKPGNPVLPFNKP